MLREAGRYDVYVLPAVRAPKGQLMRSQEDANTEGLDRALQHAANRLASFRSGAILILLDADDFCPAIAGASLLAAARDLRADIPISVILAKREYEAWFLAALSSLRGKRGIRLDARPPESPEDIPNAKGYLGAQMASGRKYSETADQPALSDIFDLGEAQTCRSFRKLRREFKSILNALPPG